MFQSTKFKDLVSVFCERETETEKMAEMISTISWSLSSTNSDVVHIVYKSETLVEMGCVPCGIRLLSKKTTLSYHNDKKPLKRWSWCWEKASSSSSHWRKGGKSSTSSIRFPLILLAHTSHTDVFLSIVDDGGLLGAFTFLGYAFF